MDRWRSCSPVGNLHLIFNVKNYHTDRFWERTIRNGASGQLQKRFIAIFDKYLEGILQQAIDRSGHHIRDTQSYFDLRRKSVGANPALILLELDLDIPDEVISHPTLEDMAVISLNMIILANVGVFLWICRK
jgi:hypothetical protein